MAPPPRLKKRYGQHHLRHAGLCRPVVDFLRPARRRVVEIGPGGGVLTGELLRRGARVWAWELDVEWASLLRRRLPAPELAVVAGDALNLPWSRLPDGTQAAGNLPYAIATRLIQDLLASAAGVGRAAFLVQAEVGRRLVAGPGDADYGALSVLVQARSSVALLGRVRRASFRPPPRVEGAFVGLERRRPPVAADEWPRFEALVRVAFARRRKTLRNALAARWPRPSVDRLLAARGLSATVRAGELGLDDLVRLFRAGDLHLNRDGC